MSDEFTDRKPNKVILEPMQNAPNKAELSQQDNGRQKDFLTVQNPNTNKELASDRQIGKVQITNARLQAKRIMAHKLTQWFIIFLVLAYTILIFTVLAIDDLMDKNAKEKPLQVLLYVEITILIMFVIEISLTAYAQGFKFYFRDGWFVFDAVVIFVSIIFVIVDLAVDIGDQYKVVSSMVRGIFRFVRIFLLIRKVQTFKKIKTSGKIKTASEKILDTLHEIKDLIEITEVLQDIDWAIDMIGSNKLYDPIYNRRGEQNDWLDNYYQGNKFENNDDDNKDQKISRQKTHKINPRNDKNLNMIPSKALDMFDENINDLTFNCVELQKITKGVELQYLLIYLFEVNDLYSSLNINHKVLRNFALKVQNGYLANPYHNALHAFDVTQTVNFFLKKCNMEEILEINQLELCTLYVSAAYHDIGHPGWNNHFLNNTYADLSITYNEVSVLENFHLASAFAIMQDPDNDITQNFSAQDYKTFRQISISVVLSTDMASHFAEQEKLRAKLESGDYDFTQLSKDKMLCMNSAFHASDISNPIKSWECCQYWTDKLFLEFNDQGDRERAADLKISILMNKYTTNIAQDQKGFIDNIVFPLYNILSQILPELTSYLDRFTQNKQKWQGCIPEYEKKKEAFIRQKDTEEEDEKNKLLNQ